MMAIKCGLAAAAVLLALSISSARACDDFDEEVGMLAAQAAAKAARTADAKQEAAAQVAAALPGQADATSVASAEPRPAPSQAPADPASAVAR
jgi:hypothetical protein